MFGLENYRGWGFLTHYLFTDEATLPTPPALCPGRSVTRTESLPKTYELERTWPVRMPSDLVCTGA